VERNQRPHLVIVGRCHLRDGANLVERQSTLRERGPQHRQSLERVAGANHFAPGPEVHTDVDRQPVRARPNAGVRPGAVIIEFGAELHELCCCRVDTRGEHADALLKFDSTDVLHWHIVANICSLTQVKIRSSTTRYSNRDAGCRARIYE
jgi:hypothetical protein